MKGLIRFLKPHLVSAGYSVAVGDFNGDGIEGKPLASVRTPSYLAGQIFQISGTVHREMHQVLGMTCSVQQSHCALGSDCCLCLALCFRLCVRSPTGSKNSGHGKKFET